MIDPLEVKKEVKERANVLKGVEEELTSKLRVVGLYPQKHKGYFMLRTRIPGGFLTAEQVKAIGEVAAEYARGPEGAAFVDLTTRQQVQMHWIRLGNVPEIWERYEGVGLTTLHTCGNAVRNIVACPLAGVSKDEVINVLPYVEKINRRFLKKEYANLPRKFKISISGCVENCTFAELNDIALTPAAKGGEMGFNVLVGGGLGDTPRMASELDVFAQPEKVVNILQGIVEFYRTKGDYENPAINRFRILVAKIGVEKLREELEDYIGFELPRAGESLVTSCRYNHIGVYPQKQEGLSYVGACVPAGRLKAEKFIEFARISIEYGSRDVRITPSQDLLLPNIPEDVLDAVLKKPLLKKYTPFPDSVWRGILACSGSEFCEFGIVEPKKIMAQVAGVLGGGNWQGDAIRIYANGCTASCARVQIADIALRGTVKRTLKGCLGAVDVGVGGSLENKRFIEWIIPSLPVAELPEVVEDILGIYLSRRKELESFQNYCARGGAGEIKKILAGDESGESLGHKG